MTKINYDLIIGTTHMLTIALCIMTLVYVAIMIKEQKKFSARTIFTHWVLFTGVSFIIFSIISSFMLFPFLRTYKVDEFTIDLLRIYNGFMRGIGVAFIFTWFLFFQAIDSFGYWIDTLITRKKEIV